MARYCFGNNRDEELEFASLLNNLANDIISGRVRLIGCDHQRETDRETLSIYFHRLPQEDN
jgi:hypothetical protein